ncbi:PTS transporter subunit EIIC [Bacillus sp. JJ1566]|uniref:PTS transporter subunit EIIC n=1 Tax=Bacillus sp. JJ1566 TaxID=3122961 RepID=UPI002FFFF85D
MRKFGQFLAAMVYQNLAVIIAVGIIREMFGIYGYFYNDRIILLVNPIYETLLPILLAYTGGRLIGGQRGAVVASIVVYGLTLSSSVPIIIGAMIIGPFSAWIIHKIETLIKEKIPVGYELLITNLITALVGILLTIACFLYVGQTLSFGIKTLNSFLQSFIYSGWLPMMAIIIEPAKVFFFNNFINYGILSPLGIQQAKELGKSIFFLLESNPGPGLGILLAYYVRTIKEKRRTIKLSVLIHFVGGIHEIYFPYILRNWKLLIAVIVGGISGNFIFQLYGVGLVSLPSPGSIVTIVAMSPKIDLYYVLLGILVSIIFSFLLSYVILGKSLVDSSEEEFEKELENIKNLQGIDRFPLFTPKKSSEESSEWEQLQGFDYNSNQQVKNIVFVCEAGIGSSAMGAAMLRKKLRENNLTVEVTNSALHDVPVDADIIICHNTFYKSVRKAYPEKQYYALHSFTDIEEYNNLISLIKSSKQFHYHS